MLIDCNSCTARPAACDDCVMTVLLGPIEGEMELDDAETQALDALADGGLVPPLRMVPMLASDQLSDGVASHQHRETG